MLKHIFAMALFINIIMIMIGWLYGSPDLPPKFHALSKSWRGFHQFFEESKGRERGFLFEGTFASVACRGRKYPFLAGLWFLEDEGGLRIGLN